MSFITDPLGDLVGGAMDLIGDALETVGNVVEGVLENPLPMIETIALTMALGPGGVMASGLSSAANYAIANAAVAAANGGDIGQIALSAAASYGGGQIGNYAGNLASEMGMTDASLRQIVVSSSAAASAAAISGKPLDQILAAGASGAIGTYVRQNLIANNFDPTGLDTRSITNATTAAANAILSGKDVNLAIGNALATTMLSTAVNQAGGAVKTAYNSLNENTTKLGDLNNSLYEAVAKQNTYFESTVEGAQQEAQQKYDNAMAARNALDLKNAEFQTAVIDYNNALDKYNANPNQENADLVSSLAEKANAFLPELQTLGEAYNAAANDYIANMPKLEEVQKTYQDLIAAKEDLQIQVEATNKVVASDIKATTDALYNSNVTAAPTAVVDNAVKSTLDTVMDANATALQNAQATGNSLLIQAVLDGNTAAITALNNNDIAGAELAVKGALEATKPDLSQGDVNVSTTPTTPINYQPGTEWDPVVVTGTEKPVGETSGTGTSGTGTGSTQYPLVDNGDGTTSQVNPDGSITMWDNNSGAEIGTYTPGSSTEESDLQHIQETLDVLRGVTPTGPTGPAPTGPIEPAPTGPIEPAPTGPVTPAPTGPIEPTPAPTGPIEPTPAPTGPIEPTPAPTGPIEPTPAPTGPIEPTPAPTGPIEPTPAPTGPIEPTPAPTGPIEPTPAPTGPIEPTPAPTGPVTPAPTGPIEPIPAPTGPIEPTPAPTGPVTPITPVTPYVLGQVTNPDGSITTTYSDGSTTTTPAPTTGPTGGLPGGDTTTPGTGGGLPGDGTGVIGPTGGLPGGGDGTTPIGPTGGLPEPVGPTGPTGTTTTPGTTGGTGTTTTGGGSTSTGSGSSSTAATVAGGLGLLGSGINTLGGVALPEAKFVKGTQIASPLAASYNIPTYKPQQSQTNESDLYDSIEEAADGGLIQHMADGGDVFPAAPGLYRGRKSQFANPLALSLVGLAPTDLHALGHADGGSIEGHNPQFFSEGGLNSLENTYVKGDGDGTSDSVPAMLANGEFVIPADVVSSLGNGSNDAGAQVLDKFLVAIRNHKKQTNGKDLPPDSKGPLAYLLAANNKRA